MPVKTVVVQRVLRLFLWASAGSCLAWTCLSPRFRDGEGFLRGEICLPIAASVALALLAYSLNKPYTKAVFWFALALVGQAVALQMIEAGQLIRYQHYRSLERLLTETNPLLVGYLAVQSFLVVVGISQSYSRVRPWTTGNFKIWKLVAIGAGFLLSSVALSRDARAYLLELPLAALVQMVNLANIVLAVLALPRETLSSLNHKFEKLLHPSESQIAPGSRRIDRFSLLAAAWVLGLAAVLSFLVYERHPHLQDEVMFLYQARYLANGELTVPAAPVPQAFSIYIIPYEDDRWFAPSPPGWPAVLAVGALLRVPWLVNPVLAGLNVLLCYVLLQALYSRRIARIAVLLLCASPWYVFMGMNFMTTHSRSPALWPRLCVWCRSGGQTGRCGDGWLDLLLEH